MDQPTQWHLPTDPALRTFFFALLFAVRSRPSRSATRGPRTATPGSSHCDPKLFALRCEARISQCEQNFSHCEASTLHSATELFALLRAVRPGGLAVRPQTFRSARRKFSHCDARIFAVRSTALRTASAKSRTSHCSEQCDHRGRAVRPPEFALLRAVRPRG